jgi:hypothetical protein
MANVEMALDSIKRLFDNDSSPVEGSLDGDLVCLVGVRYRDSTIFVRERNKKFLMQFHTSSGSAPPAMFSAQYQAAAGSPQQQVTILEQAGDYLKQPSASLAEDQPTVLDILRTLRLAFPGNQMQQSLTLFQSIINRLIALPSAPTPELMHQIGLAITELCMLGNENTAIMNGTWKCFMKLIAKHPQSFSADLVQFIFLVIVYSLLIKMQANMNVQATSIYIKFFSSHLTTLLRLFPKQLLNSLPYIIRLLVLIKSYVHWYIYISVLYLIISQDVCNAKSRHGTAFGILLFVRSTTGNRSAKTQDISVSVRIPNSTIYGGKVPDSQRLAID